MLGSTGSGENPGNASPKGHQQKIGWRRPSAIPCSMRISSKRPPSARSTPEKRARFLVPCIVLRRVGRVVEGLVWLAQEGESRGEIGGSVCARGVDVVAKGTEAVKQG